MKRALIVCVILVFVGLIPVMPLQAQADPAACPGALPSRLVAGEAGRILPGLANNRRAASSQTAEVLGLIPGGAVFDVIDGPVCNEGYAWWQVAYQGRVGWTVEGDSQAYWTEPLVTITSNNAADVVQMAGLGRDGGFIGFSPDRRTLAMSSPTGVQLWDAADLADPPREIDPLRQIYQAVFSPDWRLLATEGRTLPDNRESSVEPGVRLFDVATGRLLHEFEGPGYLAFSPDGSLLYTYGSWIGHVWDTTTFAELAIPEGYSKVLGIAWNNTFLVVDEIGMVWQWDPRRGAVVGDAPFFGPVSLTNYSMVSLNPAGTLLIAENQLDSNGYAEDEPVLWDLTTGTARYRLDQSLWAVDWASGLLVTDVFPTETVVSVMVVDIATGREVARLPLSTEEWQYLMFYTDVLQMTVSPDRSLIALGGEGGLGVWKLGTTRLRYLDKECCGGGVVFNPLSGVLMYGVTLDDIRLWNPALGLPFSLEDVPRDVEARADVQTMVGSVRTYNQVAYAGNGGLLVAGDTRYHIHIWDATTWRELSIPPESGSQYALSPTSSILVYHRFRASGYGSFAREGSLYLWDMSAAQKVGRLVYGDAFQLDALAVSPVESASGRLLVAATVYRPAWAVSAYRFWLYVWDSALSEDPIAMLSLEGPAALAFSPDGTRLAAGRRVFDLAGLLALGKVSAAERSAALAQVTRATLATRSAFYSPTRIVFSPDGTLLVTMSGDAPAILWDAASGQPVRELALPGKLETASGAAFSPDGRLLALSGAEHREYGYSSLGQLYLFDVATGKLLAAPEGHRGAAWDVAFSPDGRLIASAGGGCIGCESYGWDDAIRLWYVDPDAIAGRSRL